MTTSLRRTAREALAALLTTGCTTATAVYDNRVGTFEGKSPVIVVSSYGSSRSRLTARGKASKVFLQVDTFAVYATEDGAWTESNAEDALDALDEEIAAVLASHQVTTSWKAIDEVDRSQRLDVMIGGEEYAREMRVVEVEVYG